MEKHTINIDVNTQKANADVDKLDKNFTDLNKTVENLADTMDMDLGAAISEIEDQLTQLAVQGKQNTEEFKSLAKEAGRLKGVIAEVDAQVEFFAATNADVGQKIGLLEDQMYRMAIAGDTTSAEFRKIQGEAAALKQSVIAVDMALDGMAMTTSQRLSGALGGVAGGFAAAQGAMASFGGESEAVNQAILKVQAAMALTQGVDAVRQAVPAFTALKTSVMGAFQGMTTASKAFALTGIGLVITLIAGAVAAFSSFQKSTDQILAENKKLMKSFDDTTAAIERQKSQIESNTDYNLRYAQALGKSEEEIAKIRDKGRKDIIEKNEEEVVNLGKKIDRLNSLEYQRRLGQQASSKEQFDELERNRQKEINIERNKLNTLKVENIKIRRDINIDSAQTRTDDLKDAEEKAKAANEAAKQRASERAQQRKDELAKITEAQKEYDENETTRYMTEQQKEIYEVQKKYDELLAIAKKYGKDNTQILINQKNEENDINTKYEQERIAKEQETDKQANDLKIQAENEFQAQIEAIEETNFQNRLQSTMTKQEYEVELVRQKYFELEQAATGNAEQLAVIEEAKQIELATIDTKYKEEQKAREKQLADMRIDAVKGGLDAIGQLAGAFAGKSEKSQRRAFNVQKAAGIASATIDTYKSAQAAFASAGNPILGAVFAAIAVAAGIANITKIAKTKFEGGGGAGSVSSPSTTAGAGSITTPEFNIVGGNTANQLATLGQQPVQAYVVSGEVSSAQSLDRNRVQNATL